MNPNVHHGLVTLPVRRLSQACVLMAVVSLAACGDALETTQTTAADPAPAASETALSTEAGLEQKLKALEAQLAALGDLPADDPEPSPLVETKASCSSAAHCNQIAFWALIAIVDNCGERIAQPDGINLVGRIGSLLKQGGNWHGKERLFHSLLSGAKGVAREPRGSGLYQANLRKAQVRAAQLALTMHNVAGVGQSMVADIVLNRPTLCRPEPWLLM